MDGPQIKDAMILLGCFAKARGLTPTYGHYEEYCRYIVIAAGIESAAQNVWPTFKEKAK